MKVRRVGGRVLVTCVVLSICGSAFASDKPAYPTTIEAYGRIEAGAKIIHIAYPSDGPMRGADGTVDFDSERVVRQTLKVGSGETLSDMLHAAGVSRRETASAVKVLQRHTNLRRLQIGQRVTLYLTPRPRPQVGSALLGLALDLGRRGDAIVFSDFNKRFSGQRLPHEEAIALLESVVVIESGGKLGEIAGFVNRDLVLRKGENINRLLINNGATTRDGHGAAALLAKQIDMRRIQIGQKVTVTFETFADDRPARMAGVAIKVPGRATAIVGRGIDGKWRLGPAHIGSAAATARDVTPHEEPRLSGDAVPDLDGIAVRDPSPDPALPIVVAGAERTAPTGESETRTVELRRGDRLFDRLLKAGATRREADRAVKDLGKVVNLRRLRIGEKFRLTFVTPSDGERPQLTGLSVTTKAKNLVVLGWPLDGSGQIGTSGKRIEVARQPGSGASVPDATAADELVIAEPEVFAQDILPLSREVVVHEVARGDNLFTLLRSHGASVQEIDLATRALRRLYNPNRIRVGRRIIVDVAHTDAGVTLTEVTLQTGRRSGVAVSVNARGQFVARKIGQDSLAQAVATAQAQMAARLEAAENGSLPQAIAAVAAPPKTVDDLDSRINGYAVANLDRGINTTVIIERGSTLMEALVDTGGKRSDAHQAIQSVRELFDPRRLRAGQSVSITLIGTNSGDADIGRISLALSADSRLDVVRLKDGRFVSGFVNRELVLDHRRVEGTIQSSLYDAVLGAGVPHAVLMDLIRVYSFDIDFQRDIQRGDRFEIMYEMFTDDTGTSVKPGDILFARMNVSDVDKPLYRFETENGRVDYFDAKGQSSRKALMRTPIDGARLSSGFGMRKHPILRYSKMHKGLDFAAPRGTPIYAAGDGVIERASRHGAYGNYIRIRHNSEYATAYAHMTGFAKGMYPGKRVQQGQTIGYVGTTGRSTGPHLHYEVLRGSKQVNPLSVKLPTGAKLTTADLKGFARTRDSAIALFSELPSVTKVANAAD